MIDITTDREAVVVFEEFVFKQKPAEKPWEPVTDYSFEGRQAAEGEHPDRIRDVFHPAFVLDVGAGPGHLVRLLRERGIVANGVDLPEFDITAKDVGGGRLADLVICREVLEHLTVTQIAKAVRNLVHLSRQFVYVTTRFHANPAHLLDVQDHDDLDPTHITLLNKDFLRTLFVLEGCTSRYDLEQQMDWQHKGRCLVFEVPHD